MSQLFGTTGNTYAVAATTTSGATTVAIQNNGQFMVDNTGSVPVFLNHGANVSNVTAVIPTTGADTKGFWVNPGQTKWFSTNIQFNQDPQPTWYVAAITASSTANVYVSRCTTYP